MKNIRKYSMAALALAALAFQWLPLVGKNNGLNAMELISILKAADTPKTAILIAAIVLLAIVVMINCFWRKKAGTIVGMLLCLLSGGGMGYLLFTYAGSISGVGYGGIGMLVCCALHIILSLVDAVLPDAEVTENKKQQGGMSGSGYANSNAAGYHTSGNQMDVGRMQANAYGSQPGGARGVTPASMQQGYDNYDMANGNVQREGWLKIYCEPYRGSALPIKHMETIKIGRDASASNLVIQGNVISRCHCSITYNAMKNTYLLTDTSTNGTYLSSGQRVPKNFSMEIQPGFRFYLGETTYMFQVGE